MILYDRDLSQLRKCGDCQLCCKLLPVRELEKGADQRCQHQRTGKGCMIYRKPGFPPSCHLWNCQWIMSSAGDTRRPDRAHFVIDVMPDFVKARDDRTGEITKVPVVQIWVDLSYPKAHRDPALRAWLAKTKQAALARIGSTAAVFLVPPGFSGNREWIERASDMLREEAHTVEEILEVMT